jgi:hypothetical protein
MVDGKLQQCRPLVGRCLDVLGGKQERTGLVQQKSSPAIGTNYAWPSLSIDVLRAQISRGHRFTNPLGGTI